MLFYCNNVISGALKRSQVIDSHIIDHFIPFLPLERIHIAQCIRAELRHLNEHLDSDKIKYYNK